MSSSRISSSPFFAFSTVSLMKMLLTISNIETNSLIISINSQTDSFAFNLPNRDAPRNLLWGAGWGP